MTMNVTVKLVGEERIVKSTLMSAFHLHVSMEELAEIALVTNKKKQEDTLSHDISFQVTMFVNVL